MSNKRNLQFGSMEKLYPTPRQLKAPLFDPKTLYEYDYFANFHLTYNGCSVCLRVVRNKYGCYCRGWLPRVLRAVNAPLVYDSSWTKITERRYVDDAVEDYRQYALELLNLSDEDLRLYNDIGRRLTGLV